MGTGSGRANQALETQLRPARPILVIEDEPAIADSLDYSLRQEGFAVVVAGDGESGVACFRAERPMLVLLDLNLPKLSGFDVCRTMRAESDAPIVVLSARDSELDTVTALELGADDYVTKPFSFRELLSRLRAHLRRAGMGHAAPVDSIIRGGPVELDVSRHEVHVRGHLVDLTRKEFDLLEVLLRGRNRLRTRDHLLDAVWGPKYFGDTKTLDVHVKRLRGKIEHDPHLPKHLVTVRGLGYRFIDEPDQDDRAHIS